MKQLKLGEEKSLYKDIQKYIGPYDLAPVCDY